MTKWPKTDEERAKLAKGKCPGCDDSIVDLRGSNQSQFTLRSRGRCCGDGMTYECNRDMRIQRARES